MKTLTIIFLILLALKLAQVGLMATASWWLVFSPLILLAVIKFAAWVFVLITVAGIFPALTRWIAKNSR